MSAHVDSVTMAKRSDGNRVEVQMFHFQVMSAATMYKCRTRGSGCEHD